MCVEPIQFVKSRHALHAEGARAGLSSGFGADLFDVPSLPIEHRQPPDTLLNVSINIEQARIDLSPVDDAIKKFAFLVGERKHWLKPRAAFLDCLLCPPFYRANRFEVGARQAYEQLALQLFFICADRVD